MKWKDLFMQLIKRHGECYVNYLMGATLHYKLFPNDFIVCWYDYNNTAYGCCKLDSENFDEWIDLSMVASITSNNIFKK